MHPSESSLNYFGFLNVFLDFPSLLSLELVFLVAKASRVLFIISQVFAHVIASGPALLLAVESPGPVVVLDIPFFMIVLAAVGAMLTVSRVEGNGVDCRLFLCGSTKSTLVPCVRSAAGLSCEVELLKIASNFACIAHGTLGLIFAHCVHSLFQAT